MICSKCSNIYDDSLPLCPECGSSQGEDDKKNFVVTISEESFAAADEELITDDFGTTDTDDSAEQTVSDDAQDDDAQDDDATADDVQDEDDDDTKIFEPSPKSVQAPQTEKEAPSSDKAQSKKEPAGTKAKAPAKSKGAQKAKESRQEKAARNFVVSLASVMGAVLLALCVIGFTTDVFKKDEGIKAVALLGLSSDEQMSLEKHLSAIAPIVQKGFDSETTDAEEFLSQIHPGDANGVFKLLGKSAKYITDEADPAQRFDVEGENSWYEKTYSYYKVEKWQIDSILEAFDVQANYALNNKRCYYYDDYYYFSCEECQAQEVSLSFDITESKRIQGGGYYAVCSVFNATDSKASEVYVIAEKVIGENEDRSWKITKIQDKPVFDGLGIMLEAFEEGEFEYEMKSITFDAVTDGGKTFCQYTVEYPVFKGESNGEKAANTLYESIVSGYKAQADDAEKDYKKFKKDGYDEASLPLQVYFTADVSYGKGEYIGVVNKISKSVAEKKQGEDTAEGEAQNSAVTLSTVSLEGYTFDVLTGEYVTKDAVIGKDYLKISELLYRIYNGYDYSGVMSDENIYDEVPEDVDAVGKHFYDGASTLCNDGYAFFAVSEGGYAEKVVIPFDTQGVFTKTY